MNSEDLQKQCSIIVSSCDAFSDVWEAFFTLFFRYWPDCPFPIYLVSESKTYTDSRITPILVGADLKWASNTKKALNQISTPHILYMQEDYLLQSPVQTEKIVALLKLMQQGHAACIRLYPSPGPNKKYAQSELVGEIDKNSNYSISLQATLWDKQFLLGQLIDGESGWDMEFKGSERAAKLSATFLCVYISAIDYFATAIKRGRWYYDAVQLCEREGIKLDLSKRPVETQHEYYFRLVKQTPYIGRVASFLERRTRNYIKLFI